MFYKIFVAYLIILFKFFGQDMDKWPRQRGLFVIAGSKTVKQSIKEHGTWYSGLLRYITFRPQ
jgi:hypothetical protein